MLQIYLVDNRFFNCSISINLFKLKHNVIVVDIFNALLIKSSRYFFLFFFLEFQNLSNYHNKYNQNIYFWITNLQLDICN